MPQPGTRLRALWAPGGGAEAAAGARWSDSTAMSRPRALAADSILWCDHGATARSHDGTTRAEWSDTAWQPALTEPMVTLAATPTELRITTPAAWRAHLYFGWHNGNMLLSSDLRSVAAALGESRPDPAGVAAFLSGRPPARGLGPALYRGLHTLEPGHTAAIHANGTVDVQRSWTPESDAATAFAKQPLEIVTLRLREHLDHLADRILSRHQRVACLFSGGLDSSLVAATLLRRAPERVVLFNVGSSLGTAAEARLRSSFLQAYGTTSEPVDLPSRSGLVRSLKAVNALSPLPTGSPFAHVFEAIISAAQERGCDAVVTGDGGDEVFAEREELLADLIAQRSSSLPAALGHFALRNGEHAARTLARALRTRRALEGRAGPGLPAAGPAEALFGDALAAQAAAVRRSAWEGIQEMWATGWTYSGLGSYHRAAAVPRWEPASSTSPGMPVLSPLADAALLADALSLARAGMVPPAWAGQPKWLLRQAALAWLPPQIAMHRKIGSADVQILARARAEEHTALLSLLTSSAAVSLGLRLPAPAQSPDHPLWKSDDWIAAAALTAWFDQPVPVPAARRPPAVRHAPVSAPAAVPPFQAPAAEPGHARAAAWRIALLSVLNLAAQAVPGRLLRDSRPSQVQPIEDRNEALETMAADLARRSCALPWTSGASRPMATALSWYLRLTGIPAAVVAGTQEGQSATRYWVRVGTAGVDVHGTETPLLLRQLRTSENRDIPPDRV